MTADRCRHDITPWSACDICNPARRAPRAAAGVTSDEPTGHRGHPTDDDVARAAALRPLIIEALGKLAGAGVDRPIPFLAELARMEAQDHLTEDWADNGSAASTIRNVVRGGGARAWSLDAIAAACRAALILAEDES